MLHVHKWSEWLDTRIVQVFALGPSKVVDAQERRCKRCGKKSRRLV